MALFRPLWVLNLLLFLPLFPIVYLDHVNDEFVYAGIACIPIAAYWAFSTKGINWAGAWSLMLSLIAMPVIFMVLSLGAVLVYAPVMYIFSWGSPSSLSDEIRFALLLLSILAVHFFVAHQLKMDWDKHFLNRRGNEKDKPLNYDIWQPDEEMYEIDDKTLYRSSIFFAAPPSNMGDIAFAQSDLEKSDLPVSELNLRMSQFFFILLMGLIGFLLGNTLEGAGSEHYRFATCFVFAVYGGYLSVIYFKYEKTCRYVHEEGISVYRLEDGLSEPKSLIIRFADVIDIDEKVYAGRFSGVSSTHWEWWVNTHECRYQLKSRMGDERTYGLDRNYVFAKVTKAFHKIFVEKNQEESHETA